MDSRDLRQIAEWLVDHGFTVEVDYEAVTITIKLSGRPG